MLHTIAEQLRPLLVAWLLLTVPVVCHNQTAVAVVGLLTAGHGHSLSVTEATSAHASHGVTTQPAPSEPQARRSPQGSTPLYEWCASHSGAHTHGLPEGRDSVGLIGAPGWSSGASCLELWGRWALAAPESATAAPPAPPPRALL